MHLKMSYSICHWTYHLKMGEKMTSTNLRVDDDAKYMPALLFGGEDQIDHSGRNSKKKPLPADPPPVQTLETTTTIVSESGFCGDETTKRAKIILCNNSAALRPASSSQTSQTSHSASSSTSNQRAALSSLDEPLNSETLLYRHEIRKSMRNVLKSSNNRPSHQLPPNRNSCMPQIDHYTKQQCPTLYHGLFLFFILRIFSRCKIVSPLKNIFNHKK